MLGLEKYIQQHIQNPKYSRMIFKPSVAGVIAIDHIKEGAKMILVHQMTIGFQASSNFSISVMDANLNKEMFVIADTSTESGFTSFPLVYWSEVGKLRITIAQVNLPVSVGYQFISDRPQKAYP